MPITGVLDLQRRSLPLGEIRIGTSKPVAGKDYRAPVRLDTFRFTTPSRETAEAIAAHYGGKVAPWGQRRGMWEVITERSELEVWVPPRGLAVDANMELWDGPRCLRRCDGITESRSGKPCLCPQPDDPTDPASVQRAADERRRLAALRPPKACKPLTRINVTIPDLPGMTGVWKLNTGSENAAVETADSGDVLAMARDSGVFLPAVLLIHWRVRSRDGKPYPVPVLRPRQSMREVATHVLPAGATGLLAQLRGSGEGQRALTAGEPEPAAEAPAESAPDVAAAAQAIADGAANATTREEVAAYKTPENEHLMDEWIKPPGADDETYEELRDWLNRQWQQLPAAGSRRQRSASAAAEDDGSLFDDPGWADRAEGGQ